MLRPISATSEDLGSVRQLTFFMAFTDSKQRFSSRVADYVRYRPGYPHDALTLLKNECGLAATNPSDSRQYASLTPAEKAQVDKAVAQASGKDAKTQQTAKPNPLNVLSGFGHLKIPGT